MTCPGPSTPIISGGSANFCISGPKTFFWNPSRLRCQGISPREQLSSAKPLELVYNTPTPVPSVGGIPEVCVLHIFSAVRGLRLPWWYLVNRAPY